jgi:hypothetical protein
LLTVKNALVARGEEKLAIVEVLTQFEAVSWAPHHNIGFAQFSFWKLMSAKQKHLNPLSQGRLGLVMELDGLWPMCELSTKSD